MPLNQLRRLRRRRDGVTLRYRRVVTRTTTKTKYGDKIVPVSTTGRPTSRPSCATARCRHLSIHVDNNKPLAHTRHMYAPWAGLRAAIIKLWRLTVLLHNIPPTQMYLWVREGLIAQRLPSASHCSYCWLEVHLKKLKNAHIQNSARNMSHYDTWPRPRPHTTVWSAYQIYVICLFTSRRTLPSRSKAVETKI